MAFPAAASTVDEGNAVGPSGYVTDRHCGSVTGHCGSATGTLRGRRVDRVGFGREAEAQLGVGIDGERDGGRES
jgi:hypothetical protein